jgi:ABC-type nickel/cobalt efflux system permease component RcnA
MESTTLTALVATAAFVGVVHTLAGPDHYLPFIALAKARGWSVARTIRVTVACGLGHVAGSVVLGLAGIALGLAVGRLERVEALRDGIAGWLLLGLGLAYAAWGMRRVLRTRPHEHWHSHTDGTVHCHGHAHLGQHAHPHVERLAPAARKSVTGWMLFIAFVLGPCEALIPILMYPAAERSLVGLLLVTGVFGVCTVSTMTVVVFAARLGLARIPLGPLERYAHVLAGLALAACGLSIVV